MQRWPAFPGEGCAGRLKSQGHTQHRWAFVMAGKRKNPARATRAGITRNRRRRVQPPADAAPEQRQVTDLKVRELLEVFEFSAAGGIPRKSEGDPNTLSSVSAETKVHDLTVAEFLRILSGRTSKTGGL